MLMFGSFVLCVQATGFQHDAYPLKWDQHFSHLTVSCEKNMSSCCTYPCRTFAVSMGRPLIRISPDRSRFFWHATCLANVFNKVVFPEPEGPMMASSLQKKRMSELEASQDSSDRRLASSHCTESQHTIEIFATCWAWLLRFDH